jgi:4a-hydroxytetrahydrobiopterin dehydratase
VPQGKYEGEADRCINTGEKTEERTKSNDNAIKKQYTLPSFMDGIRFVDRVAHLAEMADHHPDILINYKRVTMMLSTHSEGGITQKDFELAKEIEKAATRLVR